jgi:glycosyltransferase involved in cell wall biosynthesis
MKGHDLFLRAVSRIKPSTHLRFVFVGEGGGSWRRKLEDLAAELGVEPRLLWPGTRFDLPAVYSALDVLCSPSIFGEGFPNVLAEAMACGTFCVATDVGDSAQIVGTDGIVVARRDVAALADALTTAIASERTASAHARRWTIVSRFNVTRMVEATEKALTSRERI